MLLCAVLCNVRSAYNTVSMQAGGEQQSGADRAAAERDFPHSGWGCSQGRCPAIELAQNYVITSLYN